MLTRLRCARVKTKGKGDAKSVMFSRDKRRYDELELKLIHTQMTQKPRLRAEGESARVARMARAKIKGAWVAQSLTKSEALVGGSHS
jgi:hypothetical protein